MNRFESSYEKGAWVDSTRSVTHCGANDLGLPPRVVARQSKIRCGGRFAMVGSGSGVVVFGSMHWELRCGGNANQVDGVVHVEGLLVIAAPKVVNLEPAA